MEGWEKSRAYLISLEGHEVVVAPFFPAVLDLPLLKISQSAHLPTILHHKAPSEISSVTLQSLNVKDQL